jgi:hypothetical protein
LKLALCNSGDVDENDHTNGMGAPRSFKRHEKLLLGYNAYFIENV